MSPPAASSFSFSAPVGGAASSATVTATTSGRRSSDLRSVASRVSMNPTVRDAATTLFFFASFFFCFFAARLAGRANSASARETVM